MTKHAKQHEASDTLQFGTPYDDLLFGTVRADRIFAGNGNDTVHGGNGNDSLSGGNGDDLLQGGQGRDTLLGGEGKDVLDGGQGRDLLVGGPGVDTLAGGAGRDSFLFDGDPFDGGTPAAPVAGQIRAVALPSIVTDFTVGEDVLVLDADDFGFEAFSFANGMVGDLSGDANVLVLQDVFANARAAAQAIADNDALTADAGVFVYFNSTLNINRLVYSSDLGDGGDFSVLANFTNQVGPDAVALLPTYSASDFDIV